MRYWTLVLLPIAWAALMLAGHLTLVGTPADTVFMRTQLELAKALALAGGLVAALGFGRGEYLRRAWLLIGGCMALLLLRDLTLLPALAGVLPPRTMATVRGLLVVTGNVSQIWGTWILARAWKVAALELPLSRRVRLLLTIAVIVVVAAATAPGVVDNLSRIGNGEPEALAGLASALGDGLALCLIAPLLLTALALRGGLFGWPFSLLTASYVAWLLYDFTVALGPSLGLDPAARRSISEAFRALGCLFGFSAGLGQRFVVEQLRPAAARRRAA